MRPSPMPDPTPGTTGKAPRRVDDRSPGRALATGLVVAICAMMGFAVPSQSQSAAAPMPENAHPRTYGDGWECDVSFRIDGDACVAITVPENAFPTNRTYGAGWECLHGFTEVDRASCVEVPVPDGGYLDATGQRWKCLRGYTKVADGCEKIELPNNAYLEDSSSGSVWRCNRGFENDGETCSAIPVPENAFLNASSYGTPWTCERGYYAEDGKCSPVVIPANAYFDETSHGSGWKCDRGYAATGDACVEIELPANAHLDRSGNRWECHRNFQLSKGECILNN